VTENEDTLGIFWNVLWRKKHRSIGVLDARPRLERTPHRHRKGNKVKKSGGNFQAASFEGERIVVLCLTDFRGNSVEKLGGKTGGGPVSLKVARAPKEGSSNKRYYERLKKSSREGRNEPYDHCGSFLIFMHHA